MDLITRDSAAAVPWAKLASVDHAACERVARLLKERFHTPPDAEDSRLAGFSVEEISNFYLLVVAVCHQTSPQNRPPLEGVVQGQRRRGWDYLSARFEQAFRDDRSLLSPERWTRMKTEEFAGLLADGLGGGAISDPAHRVDLIRDLGTVIATAKWRSAHDVFRAAEGRVAIGQPNLLDLLSRFAAYRDPIRKKAFLLLSILRNQGVWSYVDERHVGPPIDYHEIRGHLRIGTVRIDDPKLSAKLLQQLPATRDEDLAIRAAVFDAVMFIYREANLKTPSQLHYLFWNFFRSCCTRDDPHCTACPSSCSLPARYVAATAFVGPKRRCAFAELCMSAGRLPKYYEHVFRTDDY